MAGSVIHSQVMQSTGNFHGRIGQPRFLIPKDIFDYPASLHPGEGVLHADSERRQLVVDAILGDR